MYQETKEINEKIEKLEANGIATEEEAKKLDTLVREKEQKLRNNIQNVANDLQKNLDDETLLQAAIEISSLGEQLTITEQRRRNITRHLGYL